MTQPTPLFPDKYAGGRPQAAPSAPVEQPLETPEILVINALLEQGDFSPEAYGLNDEMVGTANKAWTFCVEHQRQTGRAPGIDLFARSFPEIEILSGVDAQWAADRLRTAAWERNLRRNLQEGIAAINAGEWDAAQQIIAEAAKPTDRARPKGMSVYDPESVDEAAVKMTMPVPYAPLQAATKGLGLGELWYLGARLKQGKSWYLPLFALCAARYGIDVGVMSAEMPKRMWIARIHKMMATSTEHRKRLEHPDAKVRLEALEELPPMAGSIEVLDPSQIEMGVKGVRLVAQEKQLVVLDHVGLFRDAAGKRSIEDWRNAASISNDLKEIALGNTVGILSGAQVNREGETASSKPPKVSQLSQSDALGQDADVAIMMKRMGVRSMLMETGAIRNGPEARWYTKFEPATGCFDEIDKDTALQRQLEDAERLGDI